MANAIIKVENTVKLNKLYMIFLHLVLVNETEGNGKTTY